MISSTFAGATSNVEFEAFTGESTEYMPYGTAPYTDLRSEIRNIDTIQKVLKNNGYMTIGLHTYDGDFYNRRDNYKYIGFDVFKDRVFDGVVLPDVDNFVAPLLYVIVLQFISYYMARNLGNDIDKPRNLAKSVTVE